MHQTQAHHIALVLTTIHIPTVLEAYREQAGCGSSGKISTIVVGDLKSPATTEEYLKSLHTDDFPVHYLDVERQNEWMKRHQALGDFIPFNSVQRRNVGFLYAANLGCDIIISIDDDNHPLPEHDYFRDHGIIGTFLEAESVYSNTGWFNTCSLLEISSPRTVYHRGFPLKMRREEIHRFETERRRVVVNVGLWLGDPDVDTIARMEGPLRVEKVREPRDRILLGSGTMAPFNSQNTAFSTELLPCMFLIALNRGTPLLGNNNFRYDDIWMSFFLKKIVDHMGDAVCVGPPHVEQRRNPHDMKLDLAKEQLPLQLTDKLIDYLEKISLSKLTYSDCYRELIDKLGTLVRSASDLVKEERELFENMLEGMKLWAEAAGEYVKHCHHGTKR